MQCRRIPPRKADREARSDVASCLTPCARRVSAQLGRPRRSREAPARVVLLARRAVEAVRRCSHRVRRMEFAWSTGWAGWTLTRHLLLRKSWSGVLLSRGMADRSKASCRCSAQAAPSHYTRIHKMRRIRFDELDSSGMNLGGKPRSVPHQARCCGSRFSLRRSFKMRGAAGMGPRVEWSKNRKPTGGRCEHIEVPVGVVDGTRP